MDKENGASRGEERRAPGGVAECSDAQSGLTDAVEIKPGSGMKRKHPHLLGKLGAQGEIGLGEERKRPREAKKDKENKRKCSYGNRE